MSRSRLLRSVRRIAAVSALMPVAMAAQAPSAPLSTQTPAARPDFKNLRFDEVWAANQRSAHWDDAIKAIPLGTGSHVSLTLGGQLRWREESFRRFNLSPQHDDNGQSRVLLHADLLAGNRRGAHARVFAEFRDAQSYGRNLPGGVRTQDADRSDMQNLFGDIAWKNSFVRYGRQEIALGRERLIGVPDWSNTRRGSQGARAQLVAGAVALDLIDARPMVVRQHDGNIADSTQRFRVIALGNAPGAAAAHRGLPATWQGYWIEQEIRNGTTQTRRLTTGARTQWQWGNAPSSRGYTLEFEGGVQRGHVAARDINAWFWVAESQVQWRKRFGAPTLALGLEEGSAEKPGTANTLEGLAALYPAAHAHGGYADVIGRTNVREWHLISTWDPFKALSLRAAAYRFDRLRTDDGVYSKQNTVLRAASNSTQRHAADEIDVTGTWKASRHLRLIFGGAIVMPGAFLKDTPGGAHTEHWAFGGTTFTF
jgi:hypothetical protein